MCTSCHFISLSLIPNPFDLTFHLLTYPLSSLLLPSITCPLNNNHLFYPPISPFPSPSLLYSTFLFLSPSLRSPSVLTFPTAHSFLPHPLPSPPAHPFLVHPFPFIPSASLQRGPFFMLSWEQINKWRRMVVGQWLLLGWSGSRYASPHLTFIPYIIPYVLHSFIHHFLHHFLPSFIHASIYLFTPSLTISLILIVYVLILFVYALFMCVSCFFYIPPVIHSHFIFSSFHLFTYSTLLFLNLGVPHSSCN